MGALRPKTCRECGRPLVQQPRGRPRLHCSDACKLRHFRRHSPRQLALPLEGAELGDQVGDQAEQLERKAS